MSEAWGEWVVLAAKGLFVAWIIWMVYLSASVQSHRDRLRKLEERNE